MNELFLFAAKPTGLGELNVLLSSFFLNHLVQKAKTAQTNIGSSFKSSEILQYFLQNSPKTKFSTLLGPNRPNLAGSPLGLKCRFFYSAPVPIVLVCLY